MLAHGLHRKTSSNGLRVLVLPLPHLHTATIALFVKVGSRHEQPHTNGISHVLEHMLFRGTRSRPSAYELNLAIEDLGGTLYAATHVDFSVYQVSVPPDNVGAMLDVFAEIPQAPLFRDLDLEKRVLREELLEDLDDDGNEIDADNLAQELLFHPHPLGFKIAGSLENVERFTEADLRAHLERFYGAANSVLCISGAVDEAILGRVEHAFAGLAPGRPATASPPPPPPPDRRFVAVYDDGSQTDVRLSYVAPGMHHARYPAVQLLGRILDDGMSSRLHRRICDELGLAYDTFASIESFEDCGVLDLGASVEHAKTPEVLAALLELTSELASGAISQAELERARRRYLWDLEAMLDDDDSMASFYGTSALFDLPDTLESTARVVAQVTTDDIGRVAAEIFDVGRVRGVCVGVLERARIPEAQTLVERA